MATQKLTSNQPDPITGLSMVVMAWHFTAATAMDVFTSFAYLDAADWDYQLTKNPNNRKLQRLTLTKNAGMTGGTTPIFYNVDDTQWFGFENTASTRIVLLEEADVNANWTVENYIPPTPAPPTPPPAPPTPPTPPPA